MDSTAFLKNYRQPPLKARLVADALKGKSVSDALQILTFMPKRASAVLSKLIKSAVANAGAGSSGGSENLKIKDIRVDKGMVMKRHMPRARGSAAQIKKRLSHISVVLTELTTNNKQPTTKKNTTKVVSHKM